MPQNVTLFGDESFYTGTQGKITLLERPRSSMTRVLLKRGNLDIHTQGDCHVNMKAEIGVMCQEAPKTASSKPWAGRGKAWSRFLLTALRRSHPKDVFILDFYQNGEVINSTVSTTLLKVLYDSPSTLIHWSSDVPVAIRFKSWIRATATTLCPKMLSLLNLLSRSASFPKSIFFSLNLGNLCLFWKLQFK